MSDQPDPVRLVERRLGDQPRQLGNHCAPSQRQLSGSALAQQGHGGVDEPVATKAR